MDSLFIRRELLIWMKLKLCSVSHLPKQFRNFAATSQELSENTKRVENLQIET